MPGLAGLLLIKVMLPLLPTFTIMHSQDLILSAGMPISAVHKTVSSFVSRMLRILRVTSPGQKTLFRQMVTVFRRSLLQNGIMMPHRAHSMIREILPSFSDSLCKEYYRNLPKMAYMRLTNMSLTQIQISILLIPITQHSHQQDKHSSYCMSSLLGWCAIEARFHLLRECNPPVSKWLKQRLTLRRKVAGDRSMT